jgi:hypothetical protein
MPAAEAAVMMVHDATRRFIIYGGFQSDGSVSNHIQAFEGVNSPDGFPLTHCDPAMAFSRFGIEVCAVCDADCDAVCDAVCDGGS